MYAADAVIPAIDPLLTMCCAAGMSVTSSVGSCACGKVPLEILVALVVSVVADVAKAVPLVLVHVIALLPLVVQSPLISDAPGVVPSRRMPVPALAEFQPPWFLGSAAARCVTVT